MQLRKLYNGLLSPALSSTGGEGGFRRIGAPDVKLRV
jgi:hypothetical protein